MFDMTEFLKSNLIRGFHDGSFTESQVSIFAANYMLKGWFTQADFEEVIQAMQPPEEEEPISN